MGPTADPYKPPSLASLSLPSIRASETSRMIQCPLQVLRRASHSPRQLLSTDNPGFRHKHRPTNPPQQPRPVMLTSCRSYLASTPRKQSPGYATHSGTHTALPGLIRRSEALTAKHHALTGRRIIPCRRRASLRASSSESRSIRGLIFSQASSSNDRNESSPIVPHYIPVLPICRPNLSSRRHRSNYRREIQAMKRSFGSRAPMESNSTTFTSFAMFAKAITFLAAQMRAASLM